MTTTAKSSDPTRDALLRTQASCLRLIESLEAKTHECLLLEVAVDELLKANSVEETQAALITLSILRGAK
jgi:hypothetical protein